MENEKIYVTSEIAYAIQRQKSYLRNINIDEKEENYARGGKSNE